MSRRRARAIVLEWRMLRAAAILSLAVGCGGSSPSGPTPTTPPVITPAAEATFTVVGTVRDSSTSAPVAAARIQFMTGINAGRLASAEPDGRYTVTGLRAGSGLVRAYGADYAPLEITVTVPMPAAAPLDFALTRVPARTNPGPFTYTGTVWDSAGTPVSGAAVIVFRESVANPLGLVTTGDGGTFTITTQSSASAIRVTREGFVSVENAAPPALEPTTVVNVTIPRIIRYALQAVPNLRVGQGATLTTEVDTDDGLRSVGRAYTSTTSNNEAVVVVPALGDLLARAPGTATITATYSGLSTAAAVQVVP